MAFDVLDMMFDPVAPIVDAVRQRILTAQISSDTIEEDLEIGVSDMRESIR
jgi:hypothetical protein